MSASSSSDEESSSSSDDEEEEDDDDDESESDESSPLSLQEKEVPLALFNETSSSCARLFHAFDGTGNKSRERSR